MKRDVFAEWSEFDLIVMTKQFCSARKEVGTVEEGDVYSSLAKGWTAEEERRLDFTNEAYEPVLVGSIRLEKEGYRCLRPDKQINALGDCCAAEFLVAGDGLFLKIFVPFFVLLDIALDETDPEMIVWWKCSKLSPPPPSPEKKTDN